MQLHILLTSEIMSAMPDTIEVLINYGRISVMFPINIPATEVGEATLTMHGDNAVVEGSEEDVINWLKQFNGIPIGSGVPQFEDFSIMHIKNNI